MRVLIAPDKFKGTLSAEAVARTIAQGWRKIRPDDDISLLPISDGGDGFGPVLGNLLNARTQSLTTRNAAGHPQRARWWWVEDRRLAILEAAQSNGLAQLPKGKYHPFDLDTSGVARLMEFALRKGARHCIVGVGGSATNDGGFGLARGMGWAFLDRDGQPIVRWTDLHRLARIVPPAQHSAAHPRPANNRTAKPFHLKPTGLSNGTAPCRVTVATDVDNPLLGPQGATRIYGPQKGITAADIPIAEKNLRRLAKVVEQQLGFSGSTAGSGAAGGLGFGLMAFLGADRRLGFDVFAEFARLDRQLKQADLVITGEGSFDAQSLMGKGVGQCIQRCTRLKRPVFVLAGHVAQGTEASSKTLRWSKGLCDLTSSDEAMARPKFWLRRLASEAALAWNTQARLSTRPRA
jgi:glycerate kinase